jgi:serine protease inhibitor
LVESRESVLGRWSRRYSWGGKRGNKIHSLTNADLDMSLRSPPKAIGIKTAFGSGAEFSGISSEPGFAPSDVLHGAFVDVDERGTEAAAATADIMVGQL